LGREDITICGIFFGGVCRTGLVVVLGETKGETSRIGGEREWSLCDCGMFGGVGNRPVRLSVRRIGGVFGLVVSTISTSTVCRSCSFIS
jgi:hypothetical protein